MKDHFDWLTGGTFLDTGPLLAPTTGSLSGVAPPGKCNVCRAEDLPWLADW